MLVAGQEVTFLIDTGASINMLPVKYAKYGTEPYSGVLKMWNEVEDKPTSTCRMKVTNPRNGKKYSVPFVVFEGDRLPILSYRTSLQMKLITVEKGNFDMVAGVATESYPDHSFNSKDSDIARERAHAHCRSIDHLFPVFTIVKIKVNFPNSVQRFCEVTETQQWLDRVRR